MEVAVLVSGARASRVLDELERDILQDLRISPDSDSTEYLHHNQRVVNRIDSIELAQSSYVLQVADQDVDHITPFVLKQTQAVGQRQRLSQARFGSQVDVIVPLSARFDFDTVAEIGDHVKAGVDPIIKVMGKMELRVRK